MLFVLFYILREVYKCIQNVYIYIFFSEGAPAEDNFHTYINEGLDQSLIAEKRAPMRFGKRAAGFQDDLNEFKILRTVRAPMRFGKRSEKFKKAPMRFGKRAPMRFGKRDFEGPSYLNEDSFDYEDQMPNNLEMFALKHGF